MREVTATEASRNFKTVLDEAEHGETIAVTRGGMRVAVITPAPRANGAAVRAVMERWRNSNGSTEAADEVARNVAAIRAVATAEQDTDPWGE